MKNEDKWKLIKKIGDEEKHYIYKHGFARSGTNGFYNQKETPVRNSGHYLVMYSFLYQRYGEHEYMELVRLLAEYLLKPEHYGKSGSICHRKENRFDRTNGLIGQAWTVEALVEAYQCLKEKRYLDKAIELFFCQPFLEENGFWQVRDLDGSVGFDLVYNHQLWFAASGSMICQVMENKEIDRRIRLFLNASQKQLFQSDDEGLIFHHMQYSLTDEERAYENHWQRKHKWREFYRHPWKVMLRKYQAIKAEYPFTEGLELGYQLFDLYGFALLYPRYREHSFFQSIDFLRACSFVADKSLVLKILSPCGGDFFNKFSVGYNHPAFEYAFVANTFGYFEKEIDDLFCYNLERVLDNETFAFPKDKKFDSLTFKSRLYEMCRGVF